MNAPASFAQAATTWADHRTSRAYGDLESLLGELHPETDAYSAVYQAMEAIETADFELEGGQ